MTDTMPSGGLTRRERRKLELRGRILEAARELFAEQGFGETRVADVCERADIAQKTFFNYFPSKLDLLREIAQAGRGVQSPAIRSLLEFQAVRAREYFARACAALPPVDARRFVAAEIMREIYWELLQRIERAGYDVFSSVIRVPRPEQARLAVRTWFRLRRRAQCSVLSGQSS